MPVPLTLKVYKGEELVASRDYDRSIIKIGRLSSAHLCLDDDRVSRIHSVLEVGPEGQLSIIDMGSVEGTRLNGKRVNKGAVSFGDVLQVGDTLIRVETATQVAAAGLVSAAARADLLQAQAAAPVGAAALTRAVLEASTPVLPRHLRPKKGPLGAEARFFWGRQQVGEFFLKPGKTRSLRVGTDAGVDFVLDEPALGAGSFELLRYDGQLCTVRFTGKVKGTLNRDGKELDLQTLLETGAASFEDGAFALVLGKRDLVTMELGGVVVQLTLEPTPAPVWVPWQESTDFVALNTFLAIVFLAALFIIAAINRESEGAQWVDELNTESVAVALVIKPADAVQAQNPYFKRRIENRQQKSAGAPEAEPRKSGTPKAEQAEGRGKPAPGGGATQAPDAMAILDRVLPRNVRGNLLGSGFGAELTKAIGDVKGKVIGDKNGLGGLHLMGDGNLREGTTIGISGAGTRFAGRRKEGDRLGEGILTPKAVTDLPLKMEDVVVAGPLDPELIRRVIRSHRDQIRFCYESELTRQPSLAGKVKLKFVIAGPSGMVTQTSAVENSTGSSPLGSCIASRVASWIFPVPKNGGIAVVSYPFVFKRSGD